MSDKHVPENVLKVQQRDEKLRKAAAEKKTKRRTWNKARKAEWLQKAQKYDAEYKQADAEELKKIRESKAKGTFYVKDQPKLFVVTRIRGVKKLHPDVIAILRLLRMRQIHNTVFVRVNKATTNMIRKVEPYITYGFPTRTLVRKLIYKRGFAKINGRRQPINDNRIVAHSLAKFGINCVEDLIHEIVTVGPHFKQANNFLWPFKLSNPRGGYKLKRHPFLTKGDWGNRDYLINQFVQRLL